MKDRASLMISSGAKHVCERMDRSAWSSLKRKKKKKKDKDKNKERETLTIFGSDETKGRGRRRSSKQRTVATLNTSITRREEEGEV